MTAEIPKDHRDELKEFFTTMAPRAFGYACWVAHDDRQLAEDLVQEAFQAAARRWRDIRCWLPQRQLNWLQGTIRNLAVNAFRRAERDRDKQEAVWERYRPSAPDTHEQALRSIAVERCWAVIKAMPPRQRQVAWMRWGADMSIRAISRDLEIAQGTVSAHLAAARKTLSEAIGPDLPFDLDAPGTEPGTGPGTEAGTQEGGNDE